MCCCDDDVDVHKILLQFWDMNVCLLCCYVLLFWNMLMMYTMLSFVLVCCLNHDDEHHCYMLLLVLIDDETWWWANAAVSQNLPCPEFSQNLFCFVVNQCGMRMLFNCHVVDPVSCWFAGIDVHNALLFAICELPRRSIGLWLLCVWFVATCLLRNGYVICCYSFCYFWSNAEYHELDALPCWFVSFC